MIDAGSTKIVDFPTIKDEETRVRLPGNDVVIALRNVNDVIFCQRTLTHSNAD